MGENATYVSVLTISAFSLERYLAICHPLHLYTMAGLTRASRIILVLWIISIVCASPFAVYSEISYRDYPPKMCYATLLWMRLASTMFISTHRLALVETDAAKLCILYGKMRAMDVSYGWLTYYQYIAYPSCAA
ncbi:hypothetical protein SFRURICE_011936 [Spodoptera frugiperda]|nr:hypothetical protein SFRURICE_011936 [Spodoptera frugiperda]